MALIVPVYVNDTLIGSLTAVRIAGGMDKESINEYKVEMVVNAEKVFFAEHYTFNIEHRYGDGAMVLIRKMIEYYEQIQKS